MAVLARRVCFATYDEYSVNLVDGLLRIWSDGSGDSNDRRRIDPDDDYTPFIPSVPETIENPVQTALLFPLGFPTISPGSDDSSENEWLNGLTFIPENLVQLATSILLAFLVIPRVSADSREAAVDIESSHGRGCTFWLKHF